MASRPARIDETGPAGIIEMSDQLGHCDALGQAALVAAGEVSPGELLDETIRRIERINPTVNAVTMTLFDQARDAIARGLPEGPFRGVPFLVKDFYCHVAGTATTNGSRLFRDNIIDHDSELTRRYRQAGFVLAGKTNVPEMVTIGTTEPVLHGPTRNPWASGHSAGGSSGGAAAAVAAGLVQVAHANDGAGSTRIPASSCGLFGLKPSRGRITLGPDVGESMGGITAEHVVSRSVRDSAAVLDATHGALAGDPYVAPPADGTFLAALGRRDRPLRIAVSDEALFAVDVDPACRAAVREAASLLEALGHQVEWTAPVINGEAFRTALTHFWPLTVTRAMAATAAARGVTIDDLASGLEPLNQYLVELGRQRLAFDYIGDLVTFQGLTRTLGRFLESHDVWLTPTLAFPPPRLGHYDAATVGGAEAFRRVIASFAFTAPANVTGIPAASVPFAVTAEGLPVGIQIAARLGAEAVLFRLAAEIEEARPWSHLYPQL